MSPESEEQRNSRIRDDQLSNRTFRTLKKPSPSVGAKNQVTPNRANKSTPAPTLRTAKPFPFSRRSWMRAAAESALGAASDLIRLTHPAVVGCHSLCSSFPPREYRRLCYRQN